MTDEEKLKAKRNEIIKMLESYQQLLGQDVGVGASMYGVLADKIIENILEPACKKQRAYKHGIDVLAQEIKRQEREWNESCKNYKETKAEEFRQASEHHSTKLRWFKSALKIIDSNIDFYLKHTDLFDKDSPSPLDEVK